MLKTGALDAVVADRWVGSYVLAENKIRGVKLIEEPVSRSHSAIAVKKGNTNLLGNINSAHSGYSTGWHVRQRLSSPGSPRK